MLIQYMSLSIAAFLLHFDLLEKVVSMQYVLKMGFGSVAPPSFLHVLLDTICCQCLPNMIFYDVLQAMKS